MPCFVDAQITQCQDFKVMWAEETHGVNYNKNALMLNSTVYFSIGHLFIKAVNTVILRKANLYHKVSPKSTNPVHLYSLYS